MGDPYIGELRVIAFNYPPKGWAFCNGQILPIQQNQALFALLGTTYGGNGVTTFQLPNLQGRTPMHFGSGFSLGEVGGEQSHTIIAAEVPFHSHQLTASSSRATTGSPSGGVVARTSSQLFTPTENDAVAMHGNTLATTGGGQPHQNMSPYLVLNVVIALVGIFPSQN